MRPDSAGTSDRAAAGQGWIYLLLVVTMAVWGGYYVVVRALTAEMTAGGFNFWRWVLVALLLTAVAPRQLWAARAAIRRHWLVLLALGALGVAAYPVLVFTALRTTTATNGVLVVSTLPVAIFVMSWLLAGERATGRQIVAVPISLAGVAVIVTRGEPAALAALEFNRGDLWILVAVLAWSVYAVLLRRVSGDLAPLPLLTALAYFGSMVLLPLYVWELSQGIHTRLFDTPRLFLGFAYLALLVSLFGFIFYNLAVERIGPNRSGLFNHLAPVFTVLFAALFLGERLHGFHAVGIILIACGIWLCSVKRPWRKSG